MLRWCGSFVAYVYKLYEFWNFKNLMMVVMAISTELRVLDFHTLF